jgi:hypothetical protein
MTLGWAIVIVMVLYLLDKHNLLKKALLGVAALAIVAGLSFGAWYWYSEWTIDRYTTNHVAMKKQVLDKYKYANPETIKGICVEPSFKELTEGERQEVASALEQTKGLDWFDIIDVFEHCNGTSKVLHVRPICPATLPRGYVFDDPDLKNHCHYDKQGKLVDNQPTE